jgi:hypothetical protein
MRRSSRAKPARRIIRIEQIMTPPPFPDFPENARQFSRYAASIFPQLFPQLPAEPPKNSFAPKFPQLREYGQRQHTKYAAASARTGTHRSASLPATSNVDSNLGPGLWQPLPKPTKCDLPGGNFCAVHPLTSSL